VGGQEAAQLLVHVLHVVDDQDIDELARRLTLRLGGL
jgi:hypothetical protein